MQSSLLLGQDHVDYATVHTVAVGEQTGASISVGADQRSPSLRFKGSTDVPNEDALCVIDSGDLVAMAVADAHFGHEASHVMIDWLHALWSQAIPANGPELLASLASLAQAAEPQTESESTLLAAVYDRRTGSGSLVNFGDSTLAVVTEAGEYHQLNLKDERYVGAGVLWPASDCTVAQFNAHRGDTLIMFTDGVDECHYRQPATSIRPEHIVWEVYAALDNAQQASEQVAQLALSGVDGNPGGQDNVAIIVVRA